MKSIILAITDNALFWLPAFIGGLVDYFHQLSTGRKAWSIFGLAAHLLSALFFGWLCGSVAEGLEYSNNFIYASAGLGGYMGVRIADLIGFLVKKAPY